MTKMARTVLVDGYQPAAPKSGSNVARSSKTGQFISTTPSKLPKATSAIKKPTTAKTAKQ